jgi:hypothetical protein
MESKLVTVLILLLLLLFTSLLCTVSAQNTKVPSEGDTFTYERYYIVESNDPKMTPTPDVYFFTWNNSIITLEVDNVSSTIVDVLITTQFQNGTKTIESLSHNIVTGYNEPIGTIFGDPRITPNLNIIQTPQTQINYTETRTYKESTREVNVFSNSNDDGWTLVDNTLYNVTNYSKICYDAQTGMCLELESKLFVFNPTNTNLNQTIQTFLVIKDTNVWVIPEFPSLILMPLLMVAVAVGALLYKKRQLNFLK